MERVVVSTPSSQQAALVDFVRTLQQQKIIDLATGDHLRFDPHYNETLWTDVPLFGINVANYWNCDPDAEIQYINKVALLAQLTSSPANFPLQPGTTTGPFDFSLYALWDFREAFENTAEPRAHNTTVLRAAALWMIHAADRLWENVRAKRDFRHRASNGNPAKEGDASRKSRKRWDIWIKGLENGKEVENKEVRGSVEEALEQVERIERQDWRVERDEMYA
ncbi:hypothetical protein HBI49_153200 [Parastagonospora nodorum]|nr:hypothetical protein HBH71_097960 [Parastagonospora nodorum]KAH5219315.1 hypothetical protein HBI62_145850 [Parastagonospora nodorum]KAH5356779.1 hypothetical protein HBI49_153200 [Parastagonospora nodorum]KAH5452161.1 hypothetical protein HBI30_116370 [Parastagonospora nodorum]KAH5776709.1 hypothetical protein HBI16_082620 [Parastagonospora nodorum]